MADIKVELLDHMGSDLDVVNAARVSFDKDSDWEYVEGITEPDKFDISYTTYERRLSERDASLIRYLAAHNHWSPFTHCFLKFRVKAPIFVARQLAKHQVGLSWNEVSRRYVDSEPEFYEPQAWRARADNVKQGSSEETIPQLYINDAMNVWDEWGSSHTVTGSCLEAYKELIAYGVCPEQARMVLPQSMMTEWIWSGSLYAFARVVNQRLDSHAQRECVEVALPISGHCATIFPVSWAALIG